VHSPELLILDEPTRHLDPAGRAQILSKLKELQRRGMSVLISTHQLDEVEKICDSVALISSGKLLLSAPVESLLKNAKEYELQPMDAADRLHNLFQSLQIDARWEGDKARFPADGDVVDRLIKEIDRSGVSIRLLRPVPMTLDEILPKVIGRK
jgi:ABC-2 type transport system ATP-binding protein